jgi:hypothetical protein
MTSRPARTLDVIALLVMIIASVTAAASSAPGDRPPSPAATAAVTAVTTRTAGIAATTIPADFESVMGYRPQVRHGLLVDPAGTCSSPVPLPAEFTQPCAEHDLGYDLLRYADLTGAPLDAWARTAVDERLVQRMQAVCAERDSGPDRALCSTAANVAILSVDVNTLRQLRGVPEETLASWAVTGLAASAVVVLGARLVGRRGPRGRRPPPRGAAT